MTGTGRETSQACWEKRKDEKRVEKRGGRDFIEAIGEIIPEARSAQGSERERRRPSATRIPDPEVFTSREGGCPDWTINQLKK